MFIMPAIFGKLKMLVLSVLFICHLAVVNKCNFSEDKYLKMSLLSLSEFFSK